MGPGDTTTTIYGGSRMIGASYQPIEDYGLIGDMHTVALVGKDGSIDFMSFPSFDSATLFAALLDLGYLVSVAPDVAFRHSDYEHMVAEVRSLIQARGQVTAAEVRDHFNTSRRYVLALLEHLDAAGVTRRDGDVRRLRV